MTYAVTQPFTGRRTYYMTVLTDGAAELASLASDERIIYMST